jgi:hypothetical protein
MLYDPKWETKIDPNKISATTKLLWTAALRSGKYEKSNGSFEHNGTFCALGVLCKVVGVPTTDGFTSNYEGLLEAVPALRRRRPGRVMHLYEDVYTVNDQENSFGPVADWIDANL